MSHLLDVNFLLACAWSGHADHARANRWLNSVPQFATAPVTQMGFLRVSLSPGYGASFADAQPPCAPRSTNSSATWKS